MHDGMMATANDDDDGIEDNKYMAIPKMITIEQSSRDVDDATLPHDRDEEGEQRIMWVI